MHPLKLYYQNLQFLFSSQELIERGYGKFLLTTVYSFADRQDGTPVIH
jgi:hypothetical protein